MIYLTGDVHYNLKGWEADKAGAEIDNAKKYLEILKKYKVPVTLFLNGSFFDKEPLKVKELLEYDVEIGGHTYDNFRGIGLFKGYVYRKLWGCIYGPSSYQKKDIKKTRLAFEKLGLKMVSWRTHAFGSNEETFKILGRNGVRFVSDLTGEIKPFKDANNVIHLPINIPVDNNTIAYGELTPENRNPFASCTKGRIKPEEWLSILKKRVDENEKKKIPSIILIHPQAMACLDNFKLFEEIAKFLSKYECRKIGEFIE